MKSILTAVVFYSIALLGCKNGAINGDEVNVDSTVHPAMYTFKENGKKVTGTVEFYAVDSVTGKKYKQRVRELVDGIRVNVAYNYYPNGQVQQTSPISRGEINGTVKMFDDQGKLRGEAAVKDDKANGIGKLYNAKGGQIAEMLYQDGRVIKQYKFDDNGNKIIPVTDYLELEKIETGFYEYIDYNSNQILYQPIVKMKWKNIGNTAISDRVKITGTFISNDEEWGTQTDYFQGYTDAPLEPNLARQSILQCNTGYKSLNGVGKENVSCNIYVNDEFYKKVKITGVLLTSNRVQ